MRKTIKVEKLMGEIRTNVEQAMKHADSDKELACNHASLAYSLFRTALYMSIGGKDDFTDKYSEIMESSGMSKIFENKFLANYIVSIM